ncbi:unnamed protein product [Effrenium voratum]|nr:unnamed protein product [Effrenium voratum]
MFGTHSKRKTCGTTVWTQVKPRLQSVLVGALRVSDLRPREMGAGKSIHRIDEGFYICGVDALHDDKYLHQLGIKCILNAAQDRLYSLQPHHGRQEGIELAKLPELFEVKIVGADDCEDCNLSMHFQDIADFIEAGRAKGGVVVHCAAGVSRASTSCMAYLMMKEHWKLEAAHRKIHAVRNIVCPNSGFWRQLRDLEASLEAQGIVLRPLPEDWVPPPQPTRKGEEEKFGATADETRASLWGLDRDVKSVDSFLTQHLRGSSAACFTDSLCQRASQDSKGDAQSRDQNRRCGEGFGEAECGVHED